MNFLKWWNNIFFRPTYSIFDMAVFIIVINLMITDSYWWGLLYIPTSMISAIMQLRVEKNG